MRYFPAFLDLSSRTSLLVGGGELALRKLRLLLKADARVTLVAPRLDADMAALADDSRVEWMCRPFMAPDVMGRALVIAASGKPEVDEDVAAAAREAGIAINVVDRPDLCSFITPAIIDRNPLVIGISSGGDAPILARQLRAKIEAMLPARLGDLVRFAGSFRSAVGATITDGGKRRRFWERFFTGPVAGEVLAGRETAAREAMLGLINGRAAQDREPGSVAIVGAGPGDPDLLTFKAMRRLQEADVVLYDKLVGPEIIDYARRDAERIYVGKAKANHSKSQDEINALMAEHALAGKRVVRLKGGDPFIFGRGGEEMDYLESRGVAVEVVPGVTAAAGCAAAAGIPLTLRGTALAVTFLTGHAQDGEPDLDWASLASGKQTLAIYMGVSTAAVVAGRLIEHGLAASTPVVVIENGTRADQRVVTGRLEELGDRLQTAGINGPALIIVGEVARKAMTAEDETLTAELAALPRALAV
ncbi:uroporphyrinogen-III C-methyltransferase [Pelagibius litoralis]|uniref:Uroporphyrinogen-III C-methyltransferase n=1 Tax=Pelagibius litoralis TaxID=374515 RepID=A0A967EZ87_9PROT|nr:siroheme synthase CysG [Pelagibius litoralis]NIA70114.1 uroporphyrinogen-III C-methyltransferase [Pelagibius litoralis]